MARQRFEAQELPSELVTPHESPLRPEELEHLKPQLLTWREGDVADGSGKGTGFGVGGKGGGTGVGSFGQGAVEDSEEGEGVSTGSAPLVGINSSTPLSRKPVVRSRTGVLAPLKS